MSQQNIKLEIFVNVYYKQFRLIHEHQKFFLYLKNCTSNCTIYTIYCIIRKFKHMQ